MKTDISEKGWAKVPHGIVDANIPDTLKLLLWYGFDKPKDWTFSVADVSRSLRRTPQCIRDHFRTLTAAKVFCSRGVKHGKHGTYPIYTFNPSEVPTLVKSKLEVDREYDPEYTPEGNLETNPETRVETNADAGTTDSNNNLTKQYNDTDDNKMDNKKNNDTNQKVSPSSPSSSQSKPAQAASGGTKEVNYSKEELEEAFKDLNDNLKSQEPNPLMKLIQTGPLFTDHPKSSLKGWDDLFD